MNIRFFISIAYITLLLMLPGCLKYYHTTKNEISSIQKKTKENTTYDLDLEHIKTYNMDPKELENERFTLHSAVYIGTMNDSVLKSIFEQLGMSKADFAQACYFTNPLFNYTVQYSQSMCVTTYNYGFFTMNINDFWQIPRKKKLAQTELEIATLAAFQRIIEVKSEIEQAYYQYLYEKMQFNTTEKISKLVTTLRDNIEQQNHANFQNSFDHYIGDGIVTEYTIRTIHQNNSVALSAATLRNAIGLDVNLNPIQTTNEWQRIFEPLPTPEKLLNYAKKQKPELQIARMRIKEAQQQQSVARSKIIDNVQAGVGWFTVYNTPPQATPSGLSTSKTALVFGPYFTTPLPLFDQQQAAIEKARRQEEKARFDVQSMESDLTEEIYRLYASIHASRKKIENYKNNMIPTINGIAEYLLNNDPLFFINFSTYITNSTQLMEQEFAMNTEYLNLAILLSLLEKTIGGSIAHVLAKYDNPATVEVSESIESMQNMNITFHQTQKGIYE